MPRSLLFALAFSFVCSVASVGRSADKSDPDDVPLTGVVTQPSGLPAAEADVFLVTASMRGEPLVYDRTQTAADGTFRLTVPGRWMNDNFTVRQELGIVAYQPGAAPAVVGFSRGYFPKPTGWKLALKPHAQSSVRIVSPDSGAVRGAIVTVAAVTCDAIYADSSDDEAAKRFAPEARAALKRTPHGAALGRIAILLPDEISRHLQAETDDDGKAVLSGMALDDVAQLRIDTKPFGLQLAQMQVRMNDWKSTSKMPEVIALKPVGRIAGRLKMAAPGQARDVRVRMMSVSPAGKQASPGEVSIVGLAEAAVDEMGHFDVPALAEGAINFFATLPDDSPLRPRLPANQAIKVEAAAAVDVEIPLVPGIRASGLVRERASKKPLAGIRVHVHADNDDPPELFSDEQGRYNCLLPPGQVLALPLAPSSYAPLTREKIALLLANIPSGADDFELPTIELEILPDVVGAVVDEDGNAVRGAKVRAHWQAVDQRRGQLSPRVVELVADDGTFSIPAVNPEQELLLEARTQNGFGRTRVPARSFDGKAVTLRVRSADLIALSGRVVTASGKPAVDVPVELWVMQHLPEGHISTFERVEFDGNLEIRTDAEGRFVTPRELDRESVHQARVALPGGEPAGTPGFSAAFANSTELPELVVRRTILLAGRVGDQQGKPVADAVVFQSGDARQRVQATTDAEGRFHLPDVMADPTFVFVRKPGFRFFGEQVEADEGAIVLKLTKTDERAEPLTTLPRVLPRDERLALARRLLQPCLTKIDLNNEREGPRLFEAWAHVDPADMLARLAKTPPKNPFFAGYLRRAAAQALAAEDADEALALIETIDDTGFRSMSYLDVVDSLGDDQRQQKLELLRQASVVVRQMADPAMRVHQLGGTAERFLDLGQREEAEKLLREGEKLAKQLPVDAFGGYTRGAFAEELGQIDLPAALELMKGLTDVGEFDRHHGNLAHELAAKQPAEAERLLSMLHTAKESSRIADAADLWGVRVCYRMAPVDLPRARAIADRMANPYLKARAYGVMAQAIAKQDPTSAAELIARAFDVLQTLVDARESAVPGAAGSPAAIDSFNGLYSAASLAGALLPAVEAVDPMLVPEYLWRAVSFRMPRAGDQQQLPLADQANAALAMMLARYDCATATAILRPIEARHLGFHSRDTTLATLMLTDPIRAVETVERFDPDQADLFNRSQLATLLTLEGDALWRKLLDMTALWSIDVEDL